MTQALTKKEDKMNPKRTRFPIDKVAKEYQSAITPFDSSQWDMVQNLSATGEIDYIPHADIFPGEYRNTRDL